MKIPLDYYRILGVPVQAKSDLVKSAYQDRVQQLPRREYSGYAIESRKNLLDKAYEILSDQSLRQDYDQKFLGSELTENEEILATDNNQEEDIVINFPSPEIIIPQIEIEPELFIGALIILFELGEYEIVLNLAQPYLQGKEQLANLSDKIEDLNSLWQDLILTVTLTNIELAKEQWLQEKYELASNTLTKAYSLLEQERLLNSLKTEINSDVHRLRPYQIWELLTKENNEFKDRRKAISLLSQMLDLRGGIEGKQSDNSGLSLDDFLKFIQQIRVYLTSAEQQELFEQEAKRPSSAASYLAAYALIARGFSENKPQLIVRAKNILISLTIHQDVYLEQSICALLLGQTTEAEFSLSQSRERETLKYIQEISEDSPDLLPGLCLYTEKWLQTEVYPQFKDLSRQQVSLKEYFNNPLVQSYLEQLSQPLDESADLEELPESFPELETEPDSITTTAAFTQFNTLKEKTERQDSLFNESDLNPAAQEINQEDVEDISAENLQNTRLLVTENHHFPSDEDELVNFSSFLQANLDSQLPSSSVKKIASAVKSKPPEPKPTQHQPSSSSRPSQSTSPSTKIKVSSPTSTKPPATTPLKLSKFTLLKTNDLVIWLFLGLLIFAGLIFLAYKLFIQSATSSLAIPISEPLIELPKPKEELVKPNISPETINQQIALDVIRKWLAAKSKATGPEYDLEPLSQILTGNLLNRWRSEGYTLRNRNAHRRYEHTVAIESVATDPQNSQRGIVIARIKEKSQYYSNGALNNSRSYEEELLVQYGLVKQGDDWFIQDVEVIDEKAN